MKLNYTLSDKARKQRLLHYLADAQERRVMMSSPLSKELRKKYSIRSLPIRRGDEVLVMTGAHAKTEGKVTAVSRRAMKVVVEGITHNNCKSEPKPVYIDASSVVINKLHLDADREALLARKGGKQ